MNFMIFYRYQMYTNALMPFNSLALAGIGRATALALARAGAGVIAVTRTQADLDALVQEVL